MGAALRTLNWGPEIPGESVTTRTPCLQLRSSSAYFPALTRWAGDFPVESAGRVLGPHANLPDQVIFRDWSYREVGVFTFNPFMYAQFTLCGWVWKGGRGVSKPSEILIPWV